MIIFLKKVWFPLLLLFIALLLPFFFSIEILYWIVLPLISVAWFFVSFQNQNRTIANLEKNSAENADNLTSVIEQYITNLESCMEQEITSFQQELSQLKTVIADAVVTMTESFNNLHGLTSGQSSLVQALMGSLDDSSENTESLNFGKFADETDSVLKFFIDHILQISKQSIEMVNVISDVGGHMSEIETLLSDVQGIADQTNLLALNAAIEAARAGEAGRGFAVVADEVRSLSKNSDKFSEEIRGVVNASKKNISQAQAMIEQMASKDMNVAITSKSNLNKMMEEIAGMNKVIAGNVADVSALTGEIEISVGNAVRGLQFEDMSRQVVEYLAFKTQNFQAMSDEIRIGLGVFKNPDKSAWEKELNEGVGRLREMKQLWNAKEKKAVSQTSMDEGEIELF